MSIIDSRDLFNDGTVRIAARIEADLDSQPDYAVAEDFDVAMIEAWKADRWHYVGIVVTVLVNGTDIADASIWGVEHGLLPVFADPTQTVWIDGLHGEYADSLIADLIPEALADAQRQLAALGGATLPTTVTIESASE